MLRIGLIGDRDDTVTAHRAIPLALQLAADTGDVELQVAWQATDTIASVRDIQSYDGIWCVPASPYRNMDGALLAIRYAREHNLPFLGTCGGFQHAVLEFARNVLGMRSAEHAEVARDAENPVIAPLSCSLIEQTGELELIEGSKLQQAYGSTETIEGYHCSYGLNERFRDQLTEKGLRVSAQDKAGDVRAMELDSHDFFIATLFQPERAALQRQLPPIVRAFVNAALQTKVV